MVAEENGVDLVALEARVDELLSTVGRLRGENSTLKEQRVDLLAERNRLIEKTERARTQVESMISRLRAMGTH